MKSLHVLMAYGCLLSCSAQSPQHLNHRSAVLGAKSGVGDAVVAAVEDEVVFGADILQAGAGLDTGPAVDYALHVDCVYGDLNTAVSRDFTKDVVDAGKATLPKLAKNCVSTLTQLKVTPSGAAISWTFLPPANPAAGDLTYTATNATALVSQSKALPNPLSATAAANQMAYTFSITANAAQTVSTDLGVTAAQIAANATVQGTNPPLFAITGVTGSLSGTECSAVVTAQCSSGVVSDSTGLTQCSGIALANIKIYTDATQVLTTSIKQNLPAKDQLTFPLTITGCDPGTTGTFTKTIAIKFVNDSGAGALNSSLTTPLKLSIKFNPAP